jgi:hypothetical protein
LIGGWNIYCVSLGPRILILISIGWQYILKIYWPLKDEEAIDWCKRILKLSLDKGNKLKEGHGSSPRKRILCVCGKERRRRMKCEEVVISYVWRGAHGEGVCKD